MCGIAGVLAGEGEKHLYVRIMCDSLKHRGPDDFGFYHDRFVSLGHRRLSIIDLSERGRQPMFSHCGRFVITYNGEVYNFKELKKELIQNGIPFKSNTDTEVVVNAVSFWGLEKALDRFIGMFAFAVWDRKEKKLYLVRDRVGIKPLYWGVASGAFFFSSEIKGLLSLGVFSKDIDILSLSQFFRHNYIPSPLSIFKDIRKLPPGSILEVDPDLKISVKRYWDPLEIYKESIRSRLDISFSEAVSLLEDLLKEAVSMRMISDVPLGVFLSGGIDSSIVASIMQSVSDRPIKTFTIGFYEDVYNEANYAKSIAKHLGTDHTELYVTPKETMEVINILPEVYDEPFADSSQIPTFIISKLTKNYVTVVLSGDGGDELFGGYNRYFLVKEVWGKTRLIPRFLRGFISNFIKSFSTDTWDKFFRTLDFMIPRKYKQQLPGDKFHKLADIISHETPYTFYLTLISHFKDPEELISHHFHDIFLDLIKLVEPMNKNFIENMMFLDFSTYLPDDILTKVDRASMAVSLEVRVPLLDHRVVEFSWKLPFGFKVNKNGGKFILKELLKKYIPSHLIERPKMGFGIPIGEWLRGPLRKWVLSLLDEKKIKKEGFLNHRLVRNLLDEHLSGKRNWQYLLWDIIIWELWYGRWF